jgi:N-acetylglucosaminyldiphosphoundecaprenol N-acetyl-beta-D-mannosaminyltransferase
VAVSVSVAPSQRLPRRERVRLLGTHIDRVAVSALAEWIRAFIASGIPHQIITANLDFIAIARRQPHFARIMDEADLVICDGKPLQWASALQGDRLPARVTGTQLVMETARLSADHGYRLFLLGAAPGVAARAAREMERLVPGVVIAGTYSPPHGPFDAAEDARIVAMIRAARTDALFVALGAPRQDEWIYAHRYSLGVPLCAGIGGVFNFLAGETRRAPEWIQQWGFEWAYRLAQEPGRLWRRYLIDDLPLFFELLAQQSVMRLAALTAGPDDRAARSRRGPEATFDPARVALPLGTARAPMHIVDGSVPGVPRIRQRLCR